MPGLGSRKHTKYGCGLASDSDLLKPEDEYYPGSALCSFLGWHLYVLWVNAPAASRAVQNKLREN